MDELIDRLNMMYSHRGDGIPTQYVNPDGPVAAELLERMWEALETIANQPDGAIGVRAIAERGLGR
jgi:hypothetical protein